jgi:hypothetical protein
MGSLFEITVVVSFRSDARELEPDAAPTKDWFVLSLDGDNCGRASADGRTSHFYV